MWELLQGQGFPVFDIFQALINSIVLLVDSLLEFVFSKSLDSIPFLPESKQQVIANLANFAYDPLNYDYMRRLNILDLFLGW